MATKLMKGVDLNGQRAVNAADGSAATDLVTLQQLQAAIRGLDWKDSVRAASTGNLTISAPGATIDGVTMAAGNRFLAKDQTTGSENGIYVWNGAAVAATRALDADVSAEVTSGLATTSTEGTANSDKAWILTTNDPIVLGTTALVFAQLGGGGASYTAGNGLTLTGVDFNVGAGNGILVTADTITVDPAIVARKYAADCAATTNPQTFTHGVGTNDIEVSVWEVATSTLVFPDITKGSGTVIVDWGSAPTAGQYRVVVQG
jgi:phage-related tail fiber protein